MQMNSVINVGLYICILLRDHSFMYNFCALLHKVGVVLSSHKMLSNIIMNKQWNVKANCLWEAKQI